MSRGKQWKLLWEIWPTMAILFTCNMFYHEFRSTFYSANTFIAWDGNLSAYKIPAFLDNRRLIRSFCLQVGSDISWACRQLVVHCRNLEELQFHCGGVSTAMFGQFSTKPQNVNKFSALLQYCSKWKRFPKLQSIHVSWIESLDSTYTDGKLPDWADSLLTECNERLRSRRSEVKRPSRCLETSEARRIRRQRDEWESMLSALADTPWI